ncbi:MAG: Glu-tRNA(Gln) amidotransferase subunit GatD [Nanoarchaeota archaeon]
MNSGDYVRLRLAREELECTLLESYDSSVVLVKLASGYNIGIPKEHILGSEVIRSAHVEKKSVPLVQKKGLPCIGLVVTGGTIASSIDSKKGGVSPLTSVEDFSRFYPQLFERVNVKRLEVPFTKFSENMTPEDWITLAGAVQEMLNDSTINGVIVTHGTDTLHYTAAALSFFLRELSKPVVLTYSQRSIDRGSSDATLNLACAARVALSDCAEVVLVGHANLDDDYCYALRGTKVRKLHSSRRDAFKSVNIGPLARVWPNTIEFLEPFKARHTGKTELDVLFNDKVALVKYYPGQSSDIIDYYRMHGYKGLVIEVLGLGNLPAGESLISWVPALKKAIREGMLVCAAAQTIYGRLNPFVYSTGRELEKTGIIFLEDMLAETAFVKLGWVLGHRGWKEKAREKMLENVAGELHPLITA